MNSTKYLYIKPLHNYNVGKIFELHTIIGKQTTGHKFMDNNYFDK